MSVAVKVLEKALCIKSILPNELGEFVNNTFHIFLLSLGGWCSAIDNISTGSTYLNVKVLLKTLLCESFIDGITEFSPLDVAALFRSFIFFAELFKFRV